ncbi:MAG: hypothetical protein JWN48_169, partial [Myxococcaceae bacterium]|nr:hypothetical protein [Myxococcaceae bacterium]
SGRWMLELPQGAHRFELRAGAATTTTLLDVRGSEPAAVVLSSLGSTAQAVASRKREYGDGLTPQQLTDVVREHKSELDRCWDGRLGERGPQRAVTATVVVRPTGRVESVVTQAASFGELTDCVGLAVLSWRFPEAHGDSEFGFPVRSRQH